ncbi:hypothetical protein FACS1894125_6010 [Actinomycetota bacterium]|nr:hypothetical protein FACS1894125_6010 [Actinomycetota bacterium]
MKSFLTRLENKHVKRRNFKLVKNHWSAKVTPFVGVGTTKRILLQFRVSLTKKNLPFQALRRGIFYMRPKQLPNVKVVAKIDDKVIADDLTTDNGGYCLTQVDVDLAPGWHEVQYFLQEGQQIWHKGKSQDLPILACTATAKVQIIDENSKTAVVSDVDDTIVVSHAPQPVIALQNMLFKSPHKRKMVRQMSNFYNFIQERIPGVFFIYLSAGPWNQFDFIKRFIITNNFPFGALILQDIGPDDQKVFESTKTHKYNNLDKIIKLFPDVKLLLIGDDGQHDVEIYKNFALEHPDSVQAIFIRQLSATEQIVTSGLPFATSSGPNTSVVPIIHGQDGEELIYLSQKVL